MKKYYVKGLFILCATFCFSDLKAQNSINQLFENTYNLYKAQRLPNGVYRDSKLISGSDYHPVSVANTGTGLIALCIAHRAGIESNVESKIEKTLETILGYTTGFNPDRNSKGFYRHFIDINNGSRAWNSEYSTIDTGLLTLGALFAKKYFPNNSDIARYADDLYLTTDWVAAIDNGNTGSIWLEMDGNGNGIGGSTEPFNEYMIIAYLAMKLEGNNPGKGTQAWNVWTNLSNFDNANYWGHAMLTDYNNINAFRSDFTIQFPFYLLTWAYNDNGYKSYMSNAANADKLYFSHINGNYGNAVKSFEWGLGAGNSPTQYVSSGYHADDIGNHPGHVVSPHIVAGFIPVRSNAKNDLKSMINANKGHYTVGGKEILWRYSLDNTGWRSDQVQGIDYSSMLFGLAYNKFGSNFFGTYNNYNFASGGYRNSRVGHAKESTLNEEIDVDNNDNLSLSPNPTRGDLYVDFELGEQSPVEISIYDINGKMEKSFAETNYNAGNVHQELNIGHLNNGVYFVYIKTSTKLIKTKVVVLK